MLIFHLLSAILISCVGHAFEVPKDAKLVAATVAKLQDKTIVTLNDVKISKLLEKQMSVIENSPRQTSMKDSVELDDVSKTVLEKVALLEAATFKYTSYDENTFKKLTDLLEQTKDLEVLGIKSDKEIAQHVKDKLIAKSFISLRSENLKTVVNDGELRTYYDKNRTQFADMPFEKFRNTIREYYLKEKLNEKLNEWFSILKSKYQVRIYDTKSTSKTQSE